MSQREVRDLAVGDLLHRYSKGEWDNVRKVLGEQVELRELLAACYDTAYVKGQENVRSGVLRVWDDNGGWIPGSAFREISSALGVKWVRMIQHRERSAGDGRSRQRDDAS